MSSALLGISGARRNACAAVCVNGQVLAACEQERLTRARGAGLDGGMIPGEAVDQVLSLARCREEEIVAVVAAEPQVRLPERVRGVTIDHHEAHAATAYLTSGIAHAGVLVCDSSPERELSVWTGHEGTVTDGHWPWRGRAFATLFAECAELFGFARGQEHRLEALARLGGRSHLDRLRTLMRYEDGELHIDRTWRAHLAEWIDAERARRNGLAPAVAAAVQARIGELLLDVCGAIRESLGVDALCLGGGLFFNTYFTTLVRASGLFDHVSVPINPGNAGLAVGAALLVGRDGRTKGAMPDVSPFLGPAYSDEDVKQTLDSCKLSYAYVSESEAVDAAVDAVRHGQLVGWFQGQMEWGHRALGHRSILADPASPYVLENLNTFLRKRERWRSFGVSVCEETAPEIFCGPTRSSHMEYECAPRDDRMRHIVPEGAISIRVQTVGRTDPLFWRLHQQMAAAGGTGVLVNTSFNGFHEPIACTPRDAVRVFYGTGLDVLVIGRFVLRK